MILPLANSNIYKHAKPTYLPDITAREAVAQRGWTPNMTSINWGIQNIQRESWTDEGLMESLVCRHLRADNNLLSVVRLLQAGNKQHLGVQHSAEP